MLVLGVQQSDSVVYTHTYSFSKTSLLSKTIKQGHCFKRERLAFPFPITEGHVHNFPSFIKIKKWAVLSSLFHLISFKTGCVCAMIIQLFQTCCFSEALEKQRRAWSLWYKLNDVKLPEGPRCFHDVEENLFFNWALFLYKAIFSSNEEEKLNFYLTSFSFCLCISACPLQW